MSRYYFHIDDGQSFLDEDGTELPDVASAETEASRVLAAHLKDHPREPWDCGELSVRISDEHGMTLLILTVISRYAPAVRAPAPGPSP